MNDYLLLKITISKTSKSIEGNNQSTIINIQSK